MAECVFLSIERAKKLLSHQSLRPSLRLGTEEAITIHDAA